jgi:predicted RNase H-like HicB family nuclease
MRPKKRTPGPFAAGIIAQAKRIVQQYDIVLRYEDGEWYGHALEYPEAMGDAKTAEKAVAATREALMAGVCTMLEAGQMPPAPARNALRTEQVNVRLTAEEKALLESRAKTKGFRGLSDFIRASAMEMVK